MGLDDLETPAAKRITPQAARRRPRPGLRRWHRPPRLVGTEPPTPPPLASPSTSPTPPAHFPVDAAAAAKGHYVPTAGAVPTRRRSPPAPSRRRRRRRAHLRSPAAVRDGAGLGVGVDGAGARRRSALGAGAGRRQWRRPPSPTAATSTPASPASCSCTAAPRSEAVYQEFDGRGDEVMGASARRRRRGAGARRRPLYLPSLPLVRERALVVHAPAMKVKIIRVLSALTERQEHRVARRDRVLSNPRRRRGRAPPWPTRRTRAARRRWRRRARRRKRERRRAVAIVHQQHRHRRPARRRAACHDISCGHAHERPARKPHGENSTASSDSKKRPPEKPANAALTAARRGWSPSASGGRGWCCWRSRRGRAATRRSPTRQSGCATRSPSAARTSRSARPADVELRTGRRPPACRRRPSAGDAQIPRRVLPRRVQIVEDHAVGEPASPETRYRWKGHQSSP